MTDQDMINSIAAMWAETDKLRIAYSEIHRAEPKDRSGDDYIVWRIKSERAVTALVDRRMKYEAAAGAFFAALAREQGL